MRVTIFVVNCQLNKICGKVLYSKQFSCVSERPAWLNIIPHIYPLHFTSNKYIYFQKFIKLKLVTYRCLSHLYRSGKPPTIHQYLYHLFFFFGGRGGEEHFQYFSIEFGRRWVNRLKEKGYVWTRITNEFRACSSCPITNGIRPFSYREVI